MATLFLVHAHPDDEAITTGGVMMKAKAHGHRVVLATATRGEVGEIYNMDEAAGKLAVLLREERPDVVVTYAADGVYGHPDHIKAHHVTNGALDLLKREGWEPRKLYYTAIPRSIMEAFTSQMPEEARQQNQNMRIIGTPDELITSRVDVHDYVDRKRAAFAAHVSQNDPNSWFATMASQIYELAFGTEYYQLARGEPGSSLPEDDLFAGISSRAPERPTRLGS